jgi:hypothetical protein
MAAEKQLDIERGSGFEQYGDLPDPMLLPHVGSRFQISERGDVLYPHYRSTKINKNWGNNRRRSQGLQGLQRRHER